LGLGRGHGGRRVPGDADRPGRVPGRRLDRGGPGVDPPGEHPQTHHRHEEAQAHDREVEGPLAPVAPAAEADAAARAHPTTRSTGAEMRTSMGGARDPGGATGCPCTRAVTVSSPRSTDTVAPRSPPTCPRYW